MDPFTHAASGAVAMLALSKRPVTLWSWPIAALACASPDIDLVFIHTPLEFLELHRGITHSFAGAPFLGLILAVLAWPLWRRKTPDRWSFPRVWLFCVLMVLLHIWLDVVTTYGTMVFIPFSHYRVRLNGLFIVDFLLVMPMLWAILRWRTRPKLMALALAWVFVYPASGIAINAWHTAQCEARFAAEGRDVQKLVVLPDVFTPLFWRVIYEEKENGVLTVRDESLNFLGSPRAAPEIYPAANPKLAAAISDCSLDGEVYFNFAVLPVEEPLRPVDAPPDPSGVGRYFYDLRFGSGLEFVRHILAMRPNADRPFLLMCEYENEYIINKMRLRFSDSGRDSGWHSPRKPSQPVFWRWLVGLR